MPDLRWWLLAARPAQRFPGYVLDLEIDTPEWPVFAAMNPDGGSRRKLWQRLGQLTSKLRSHDEMFGRCDIDAVSQRRPSQISIEQGNDASDAGDAQPYSDVFRSIGHQQADHFTFGNTLLERPSGILIDPPGELAIGHALAAG